MVMESRFSRTYTNARAKSALEGTSTRSSRDTHARVAGNATTARAASVERNHSRLSPRLS